MESLKSLIKSRLTRLHQAGDPSSKNTTSLDALPTEMVLSICDYLPSIDAVCFSLCNHRFLEITRRYNNHVYACARDKKHEILARFERDSPQYFACDACHILHRFDCPKGESYGICERPHDRPCPLPCWQSWKWREAGFVLCNHNPSRWGHFSYNFLHLRLAMRSFNYGPKFGISTDSLSFTQVIHYSRPSFSLPDITTLYSTDAQICSQPLGLHVRTQNIVLASTYEDLVTRMTKWLFEVGSIVTVCQRKVFEDLFTPLRVEGSFGERYTNLTSTCEDCNTDYRAEIIKFDSGVAFVLTRWINLGPGLTKEDPLWKKHTLIYTRGLDKEHIRMSPRQCFEAITPICFKELMSRNLSHLKDQRFKSPPFIPYEEGFGYYLPEEPHRENNFTRLTQSLTRLFSRVK
ncbi:uncharacterized protein N7483_001814 [Penicillium malachiteum]|uniref:uncharacterized protein n=1 Tax=Penicillium malachiteum TaxID=1324776 RepID=UPI002547DCB8|nr:uncharacterized protein N7483_001814 [Penicillium malachiteum]KAJ5736689.1 hypothetical protein N7483_001814 [Penicillium malachiteum]